MSDDKTDEELAAEIIGEQSGDALTLTPPRWRWIYGGNPRRDELHLFYLKPDRLTVRVLGSHETPLCKRKLWDELKGDPDHQICLLNFGNADPLRMAAISGTHVTLCPDCERIDDK